MITYDEAFARMMGAARPLAAESVSLGECAGRILARDVVADADMPPFDKSAMDGYACRRADVPASALPIIEEIPAGVWPKQTVSAGACARIFTGAPLPAGADCVVMQEDTEPAGAGQVRILKAPRADNVCRRGEDARVGDVVARAGERIGAAHIAVLASVGASEPWVSCRPRVAILATGSELVEPAMRPGPAQIRNSNAWQLAAQVTAAGALGRYHGIMSDVASKLTDGIAEALDGADLILLSGGVSTGDHDLVPATLRRLGFELVFESVAMQPGRPTIFGQRGDTYCCGLPGNPVSTYVVFELLVRPFLSRLMGHDERPRIVQARLASDLRRRNLERQGHVPVRFTSPEEVEAVSYHGSAHIHAMTAADGIVVIPMGCPGFAKGDTVRVRSLST